MSASAGVLEGSTICPASLMPNAWVAAVGDSNGAEGAADVEEARPPGSIRRLPALLFQVRSSERVAGASMVLKVLPTWRKLGLWRANGPTMCPALLMPLWSDDGERNIKGAGAAGVEETVLPRQASWKYQRSASFVWRDSAERARSINGAEGAAGVEKTVSSFAVSEVSSNPALLMPFGTVELKDAPGTSVLNTPPTSRKPSAIAAVPNPANTPATTHLVKPPWLPRQLRN